MHQYERITNVFYKWAKQNTCKVFSSIVSQKKVGGNKYKYAFAWIFIDYLGKDKQEDYNIALDKWTEWDGGRRETWNFLNIWTIFY